MIVNHADGLHEGIADRGTDKLETAFCQILAESIGNGSTCSNCLTFFAFQRLTIYKSPDVLVEAAKLALDFKKGDALMTAEFTFKRFRMMLLRST